jgi:hypothetical protein
MKEGPKKYNSQKVDKEEWRKVQRNTIHKIKGEGNTTDKRGMHTTG